MSKGQCRRSFLKKSILAPVTVWQASRSGGAFCAESIGSHSIQVQKAMLKAGIDPDFYMKTFHPDDYWSATPRDKRVEFNVDSGSTDDHDNIWDIHPAETASVMKQIKKPWIAFKGLAAGAVHPSRGFRYAFANGADFICVGMFDFQVPDNTAIAREILSANLDRERPWCA